MISLRSQAFYETIENVNSVVVSLPIQSNAPLLNMTVSESVVTMCDSVSVSLSNYSYDGGRPLRISWGLLLPSAGSSLRNYLQQQLNSSAVSLAPGLLQKLQQHEISVTVTNFLGFSASYNVSFTPTGCLQANAYLSDDLASLILNFAGDYTI